MKVQLSFMDDGVVVERSPTKKRSNKKWPPRSITDETTFFSFGAGVQSTAILLLIKHEPDMMRQVMGTLPRIAIFADTGAEVAHTMRHIENLKSSGYEITVVNNGSILDENPRNSMISTSFIPFFTKNNDGSVGMLRRKCTKEFKVEPIERKMREVLGLKSGQRYYERSVALWMGISIEEVYRVTANQSKWIKNCYLLIELGWDRAKCFQYCQEHGITPGKSRCFMCPYTSDWASIKANHPEDWERAVKFDHDHRNGSDAGIREPIYIHKSCKPLDEAVHDQLDVFDDFADECSGHCGV